ncbi:MAG: methyl-accepting chemotaxis protein, partial [Rhodocyclaceae bacterium]|nr:methyl-accepting chemotaxis protein [Rhodocyclaceae bacterium]
MMRLSRSLLTRQDVRLGVQGGCALVLFILLTQFVSAFWACVGVLAVVGLIAFSSTGIMQPLAAFAASPSPAVVPDEEDAPPAPPPAAADDDIQQAIRRLMRELDALADGDLTVRATVTENITGVIADLINYTIEELALLVRHIHAIAGQLRQATSITQTAASSLLKAAGQQGA